MTTEEKQLLLKDLCARLPYEVKLLYNSNSIANIKDRVEILRGITVGYTILFETDYIHSEYESTSGSYEHFKPYLRPMSSMTEEEKLMYEGLMIGTDNVSYMLDVIDWLNAHHFDCRGLIPMGFAIEAPADMYNLNNYDYENSNNI